MQAEEEVYLNTIIT
uniref:Uncharacterized protein n=1 Tax=Rhizophora mucronata TaxID=61149 RepID=A0A2P2NT56_RHIMU